MRMLLIAELDTEKANEAIRNGSLGKTMEAALEGIRPEAAYFTSRNGSRTAFIVFDMEDSSQIPKTAEPFFLEMGAKVEFAPVMNQDDLRKGLQALAR
ncbi:DUF3303 family protein [Streptomyces sp. YS-3]|uniref:DUF3303 family protein n=1 Tax=Streptomyces sp. YS-3 TaxID=3381352 RepID=UPI003862A839